MLILKAIAIMAVAIVVEAWALMILVGVIHSEWLITVPTIGYGSAFLVSLGMSLFASVWTLFYRLGKEVIGY